MNVNDNRIVHHINGDKLDNRISNLEILSRAEHASIHSKGRRGFNMKNDFPYAYLRKNRNPESKCWVSSISFNGNRPHLGSFIDPLSASLVARLVLDYMEEYL